jgi:diguanylate cyclase
MIHSLSIGMSFVLSHLFVTLSFQYQFTEKTIVFYLSFIFIVSMLYCYAVLKLLKKRHFSTDTQLIILVATLIILLGVIEFAGGYFLFDSIIDIKVYQVLINLLITAAVSMASLRFIFQFKTEKRTRLTHLWKLSGSVVIGISLAGLPYLMIFSLVNLDELFINNSEAVTFIPYCFQLFVLLFLFLLPDLLREKHIFEQEKKIEEQQHNYDALFNHHPNPVFLLDRDGKFINANQQCSDFCRLPKIELINKSIYDFIETKEIKLARALFRDTFKGQANTFDLTVKNTDGMFHEMRVTSIPMWRDEKIIGAYGIAQDITEAKVFQEKITYLAYHDELTGLPTRRAILEKLQGMEKDPNVNFSVLYLDLDRFKEINDLFGHTFGDEVLLEAVKRIQSTLPPHSFLARMGGDEFAILLFDVINIEEIERIAQNIVDQVNRPFLISRNEYFITVSIGGALFPEHGPNKEMILKNADTAMYSAKKAGKNNFKMFSDELALSSKRKYIVGNDLRRAVLNKEFEVYYQPKVTLDSGDISGAEALVRWMHPKKGLIAPGEFIPVAEENGLIIEIEDIVIGQVCLQLRKWMKESQEIPVAINLSQKHFYQENIVDKFKQNMEQFGIKPNLLEIEITESIMMDQNQAVISRLHALRKMGIKISIDDFGTGYSSLSYIKRLPIDKVKIDRSFIMDVSKNEDSKAIVSLILSMAEHLKLEVVAEGIEDDHQLSYLRSMKCLEGQGYLFSKPLPNSDFTKLLLQTV